MINLVCGDPITKIWIANVLFKYEENYDLAIERFERFEKFD